MATVVDVVGAAVVGGATVVGGRVVVGDPVVGTGDGFDPVVVVVNESVDGGTSEFGPDPVDVGADPPVPSTPTVTVVVEPLLPPDGDPDDVSVGPRATSSMVSSAVSSD